MGSLIQLDKIGSDPEFIFRNNATGHVFSADRLVSPSREVRLASWIGTDGHAATAEIRPGPAHNVLFHMYKIADGLSQVNKFLLENGEGISAVAQPVYMDETMGGHIHVSYWHSGKASARLYWDYQGVAGNKCVWGTNLPERAQIACPMSLQEALAEGIDKGTEHDIAHVLAKVHYLVGPLENALFGKNRMGRWFNNQQVRDMYRVPTPYHAPQPDTKRAYVRWEYRYPSSFLSSPEMAYCFLGLFKLALLNRHLLDIIDYEKALPVPSDPTGRRRRGAEQNPFDPPRRRLTAEELMEAHARLMVEKAKEEEKYNQAYWRNLTLERYEEVVRSKSAVVTPDLKWLRPSLESMFKQKLVSPLLINFEAWAQMLKNAAGERVF